MNKAKLQTKNQVGPTATMIPTVQIHKRLKTGTIKRFVFIFTLIKQNPIYLDHVDPVFPTPIATPKIAQQPTEEEDDSMFGDDLALEELDLTAIIEKKKKQDLINAKNETTSTDLFDDLPLDELGDVLLKAENNIQQPVIRVNVETLVFQYILLTFLNRRNEKSLRDI
jgi:hypothetical protein